MTKFFNVILASAGLLGVPTLASQPSAFSDPQIALSYYGEALIHPGFRVDVLAPLVGDDLQAVLGGISAGGYWHRMNESAALVVGQLTYRLTFPVGLVFELEAGTGYRHVLLDGNVYELVGDVAPPLSHWGYSQVLTEANVGLGWRFERGDQRFLLLTLKLGVFGAYPVNFITIWHPVMQLTATLPLSSQEAP